MRIFRQEIQDRIGGWRQQHGCSWLEKFTKNVEYLLAEGVCGTLHFESRDDMMGEAKLRRKAIKSKVGKVDASIKDEGNFGKVSQGEHQPICRPRPGGEWCLGVSS